MVGPKGRGSNMAALIEASREGKISPEVHRVISPIAESPAVAWACEKGIPISIVEPGEEYGLRLTEALRGSTILALAGFLRLLPNEVLEMLPGRVLNIHPSLLPKFGGRGMYGIRVHEAVIAAEETESGCTVHHVTAHYDEGNVILQKRCPVLPDDTAETLSARVLRLEHEAYPEAIEKVLRAG